MENVTPAVKLWERFLCLPAPTFARIRRAYMRRFALQRTHQFEYRLTGKWAMSPEEIGFLANCFHISIPELLNPEYELPRFPAHYDEEIYVQR